jgi:ribonuclease P protein component
VEEKHLQDEEKKEEKLSASRLMKNKIVCLSKNVEFKEILKGKKKSNKYFTIFFKKLLNKNKNKLNISFVAKKKLGNAVSRNKIKRKLRNITNEILNKLSLKLDYSYLVIAKNTILKNEYADIKKTMFTEFNKIK